MSKRLVRTGVLVGVVLCGVFLAVFAGRALSSCRLRNDQSQESRPTVLLDGTRWDFGTVTSPGPLTASFPLTNTGQRRLFVWRQRKSCDCLSMDQEVIVQPGRSIELPVLLDTYGMHGLVKTEVNYRTNDAARPTFTLQIQAHVQIDHSHHVLTDATASTSDTPTDRSGDDNPIVSIATSRRPGDRVGGTVATVDGRQSP